ncbi:MAG: serine protease [Rickettsiales bacterium]|nr:MAG: serine protease [Rickettsiales bacterium]
MLNFLKVFALSIFFLIGTVYANPDKIQNIEKVRKSIVTINSRVPVSAYQNPGSWSGTGFIVDGKNGLLVTNNHVVGRASIGTYFITFHNGQQAEAKVVYYDIYADFAIMKVEPKELPSDFEVIEFTDEKPRLGSKIFIVGNTEGQGFSFHDGYLSDLFEISGEMPQGSYVINMNTTGGASGSPILNENNQAIGVLYGGGKTHSLALKGAYVQHVLKELNSGSQYPSRKHIGIIAKLTSLDKAVKHRNFPKNEMDKYLKDYPDARNRAIMVRNTLPGGTAENEIKPGDIIWEVDGKQIGADLCLFDLILSQSKSDKLKLTIFRDGKKIVKEITLYDLSKNKISRMLDFAGGLFFEVDDFVAAKTGISIGSVALFNVQTGSSFSSIPEMFVQDYKSLYRIQVKALNGEAINSLDDLILSINKAIKQKYINIEYLNFQPYMENFGMGYISAQESLMQDITFDSIDNKPRVLKFDNTKSEWISEEM